MSVLGAPSSQPTITTKNNGVYSVVAIFDGDLTSVDIYHIPTGAYARGYARRYQEDTYNAKAGEKIAYYRALERVARKIVRKTITSLPKVSV